MTARTEPRLVGAADGPAREGGTRSMTARTELLPLPGAGDGPAREARKGTHEEGTA